MPKITVFTCDSCKKDITGQSYQTISMRRYTGQKQEKVIRLPAMWLCDKCWKKMALYMSFPPYDQKEFAQQEIIHCRDCRYSIDFYQDGCCYCKRPSKEMLYIEEGYGFYCAGAERKTDK